MCQLGRRETEINDRHARRSTTAGIAYKTDLCMRIAVYVLLEIVHAINVMTFFPDINAGSEESLPYGIPERASTPIPQSVSLPEVQYNVQGGNQPNVCNFLSQLASKLLSQRDSINFNFSQTGASASHLAVTQIGRHDKKVSVRDLRNILDALQQGSSPTQRGDETSAMLQGTGNFGGCQGGVTNINIVGQGSAGGNAITLLVQKLQGEGDQDQSFTISELKEKLREMRSQDEVPPDQREEMDALAMGVDEIEKIAESFNGRWEVQ